MSDGSTIDPRLVEEALGHSAAFRALPAEDRQAMVEAMSRVFGYMGQSSAPARAMSPNLNALRGPQQPGAQNGPGGATPAPSASTTPRTADGQPRPDSFQRAAGATRAMLDAVGFPEFTASLIQGTFQAIVDSSIQQMEAYSRLLAETAKTVDAFMADNITDDMARDHLVNNHGEIFGKDLSTGSPRLTVHGEGGSAGQLPSFLRDLGFDSALDIDAAAVDQVVVPQVRRSLAEMRHQSLATMVMMGINRIVVSDGEINAKLIFHIDASEAASMTFNDYKPTNWTLAGKLGGNAFGASGVVVNTTSVNAQSEVNLNTQLTGEVRVRFRSDYFPLERFADSAAIQLINSHARVAQPLPEGAAAAASQPSGNPGQAALPPPPPPPLPAAPATPPAQSFSRNPGRRS